MGSGMCRHFGQRLRLPPKTCRPQKESPELAGAKAKQSRGSSLDASILTHTRNQASRGSAEAPGPPQRRRAGDARPPWGHLGARTCHQRRGERVGANDRLPNAVGLLPVRRCRPGTHPLLKTFSTAASHANEFDRPPFARRKWFSWRPL
jgi:hypothetical protein